MVGGKGHLVSARDAGGVVARPGAVMLRVAEKRSVRLRHQVCPEGQGIGGSQRIEPLHRKVAVGIIDLVEIVHGRRLPRQTSPQASPLARELLKSGGRQTPHGG